MYSPMRKRKVRSYTDVEFREVRPGTPTPQDVTPDVKSFLILTGKIFYYGAVCLGMVLRVGKIGRSVRSRIGTRR
jgi:hypothetical protein